MKNKKSLLFMEIVMGVTALIMLLGMKKTIFSPIGWIKLLSISYVVVALIMMIVIVINLNKSDTDEEAHDASDIDIKSLFEVAKSKRLPKYAETVNAQLLKLDRRTELLKRMLSEQFGEDERSGEMDSIIEKYRSVFFKNVKKIKTRLELIDLTGLNPALSVDENLKKESRQIYDEHIEYIEEKINTNEKITIELDKLTTELSRINESDGENNLEPLEDYIKALKSINDSTTDAELDMLMQKY